MSKEMVKHPEHYNQEGRRECWEEMEFLFGKEVVAIFDMLSAYKYHYRAGTKEGNPEEQDKAKIDNYMNHAAMMIVLAEDTHVTDAAKEIYKDMRKVLDNE